MTIKCQSKKRCSDQEKRLKNKFVEVLSARENTINEPQKVNAIDYHLGLHCIPFPSQQVCDI